jgi:glyoxylase-like metal-dependent hydrolase (beta-lactamase superfamily II)
VSGARESDERRPTTSTVADGITCIDTVLAGEPAFNAVYLIHGRSPTLVEAGPGADVPVVMEALASLGVGPGDLAHIVVTHIHVDHAGGSGALARSFPSATVWAHERGTPHLADPTRLLVSTARTYGADRMLALYGETQPVPADRLRPVADGDRIPLGDRALDVLATPGHASHHVAFQDDRTGALFTGEAIGSHLPWADAYRPALPPPETDVELAIESIEKIRGRAPTSLLTSHFGPVADPDEGCDRGAERIKAWSDAVRAALEADPSATVEDVTAILRERASREFLADSGRPIDLARYDVIGSIGMNAAGLIRYWRKRGERETPAAPSLGR